MAVALLTLLASCLLALALPRAAHASYADVTDGYPASQEVTVSGNAIPASKIPDGTYSITGSTSSYMCIISKCRLTVKGGAMQVTFTLSKAYTRLYLGTAEEAAAKTNADGTDDSAYYKGTPPDGYVAHVYTLPISALNEKITLATYAGGTKTCKWYTRTVAFNSSSEVDEAVATGKSPSSDSDDGNGGKKSASSGGSKKDSETEKGGDGKSRASRGSGASSGSGSRAAGSAAKEASASGTASGGTAGGSGSARAASGAGSGEGGAKGGSSAAGAGSSSSSGAATGSSTGAKGGGSKVRVEEITPMAAGAELDDDIVAADEGDDSEYGAGYQVVLGIVVAAIAALAVALALSWRRTARMRHGKTDRLR